MVKQAGKAPSRKKEQYYWQLKPWGTEKNEERLIWILDFLNRDLNRCKTGELLKMYIELKRFVFGRHLIKRLPRDDKGLQVTVREVDNEELELTTIIPGIKRIRYALYGIMRNIFSDLPVRIPITVPSTELEYSAMAYPDENLQSRFASETAVLFSVNFRNPGDHAVYELLYLLKNIPLSLLSRCEACGKFSLSKKKWKRLCSKECAKKFQTQGKKKVKAVKSSDLPKVITRKKSENNVPDKPAPIIRIKSATEKQVKPTTKKLLRPKAAKKPKPAAKKLLKPKAAKKPKPAAKKAKRTVKKKSSKKTG